MAYVKVCDDDCTDVIELPLEDSGNLMLTSLNTQFSHASGLKYRKNSGDPFRLIRRVEDLLYPPAEGWGDLMFHTVYPKVPESKRRAECSLEESSTKASKLENKCTDLIILGLPWNCTSEELREHFQTFGEVAMVEIKKDINTDRPKGFGFVRFFDYEDQISCLAGVHELDGRECRVRVPNSKLKGANSADYELRRRIFVGRVNQSLGKDEIEEFFSQFGQVTDVFVPVPFRSFVFVTFTDPQVAAKLIGQDIVINNCSVHISTAVPRDKKRPAESFVFPAPPYAARGRVPPVYYDQSVYLGRPPRYDENSLDIGSLNIGSGVPRVPYSQQALYRPVNYSPNPRMPAFDYSMYRYPSGVYGGQQYDGCYPQMDPFNVARNRAYYSFVNSQSVSEDDCSRAPQN